MSKRSRSRASPLVTSTPPPVPPPPLSIATLEVPSESCYQVLRAKKNRSDDRIIHDEGGLGRSYKTIEFKHGKEDGGRFVFDSACTFETSGENQTFRARFVRFGLCWVVRGTVGGDGEVGDGADGGKLDGGSAKGVIIDGRREESGGEANNESSGTSSEAKFGKSTTSLSFLGKNGNKHRFVDVDGEVVRGTPTNQDLKKYQIIHAVNLVVERECQPVTVGSTPTKFEIVNPLILFKIPSKDRTKTSVHSMTVIVGPEEDI